MEVRLWGMEFFCYHRDRPSSVALRDELLEEHWSYMDRYSREMIARGPTLAPKAFHPVARQLIDMGHDPGGRGCVSLLARVPASGGEVFHPKGDDDRLWVKDASSRIGALGSTDWCQRPQFVSRCRTDPHSRPEASVRSRKECSRRHVTLGRDASQDAAIAAAAVRQLPVRPRGSTRESTRRGRRSVQRARQLATWSPSPSMPAPEHQDRYRGAVWRRCSAPDRWSLDFRSLGERLFDDLGF